MDWNNYKKFVPDRAKVPIGHVIEEFKENSAVVEEKLKEIKGHLVILPLKFMKNEKLSGSAFLDSITPMKLYT